ncbi:MAG TPA: hypothetical protein VGO40_19100 [Longimicrobium sp.]|nr:hypothetical protein [Longimicrobium sp.]
MYEANAGKHGRAERGRVSREPRNGQDALDYSLPIKPNVSARIGIDYEEGAYVVLRRHMRVFQELPEVEIFHGYVVEWAVLPQECRNALMRAGMANLKGKIL